MTTRLFPSETTPSMFHDQAVEPEEARSILRPQRDNRYGFGYALSPYRGCGHGCRYCFVREYPNAAHGIPDWGRWSAPKLNAPELLWSQRHKLHLQWVFLSTATDPYQPIEREFRLTRACLNVLLKCPTCQVLVHTRSALILQDVDLLKAFGDRLKVGISIPTDDDTVRQIVEPAAPPIPTRWATVERLAKAGIRVGVAATPLMPMADPLGYARRARESGCSSLWVGSFACWTAIRSTTCWPGTGGSRCWIRITWMASARSCGMPCRLAGRLPAAPRAPGGAGAGWWPDGLPPNPGILGFSEKRFKR
jgi:DNA repair photolyase